MRKVAFLLPLALLGACRDSDGSDAVNGDALVRDLIQVQTSETGAPVAVNGVNLVFSEDPAAFAAVLPPDAGPVVEQ
jgi:hypothetical protein